MIKEHPDNQGCPPFIAFIDDNGKHRGSQKIDDHKDVSSVNGELLESAIDRINELKKTLRFYHLKVPRKGSRGFEYKVANVADRSFMSSKFYLCLIIIFFLSLFLIESRANNNFISRSSFINEIFLNSTIFDKTWFILTIIFFLLVSIYVNINSNVSVRA